MSDYIIRSASETDGGVVSILAREAVDESQGPYSTRQLGSEVPSSAFNSSFVFVAEAVEEKRLIGFVVLRITDHQSALLVQAGRRADVTMLGVISERRREGIGRALVKRGLQEAKDHGATLITLCVDEQNTSAIKLYENSGWRVIDRMMAFPL